MKLEDYNEYYIQGSDHYLIPKAVFIELYEKMANFREEAKELESQLKGTTHCFDEAEHERLEQENQSLRKQLDYLRSGEYFNQLKFEVSMLEHIIENGEVSEEDKRFIDMTHRNTELLEENQELKKQLEGRNLVDLGFYDNEPVGFKYDRNINKPVLACRCDNYYYAYPTKTGWVFYRSRYLGERDKEIEDIQFIDWAYAVLKEVQ